MKSATYTLKVHTKILITVPIIYQVFCNWRPVCIFKVISQAPNKITYFSRDMFISSI